MKKLVLLSLAFVILLTACTNGTGIKVPVTKTNVLPQDVYQLGSDALLFADKFYKTELSADDAIARLKAIEEKFIPILENMNTDEKGVETINYILIDIYMLENDIFTYTMDKEIGNLLDDKDKLSYDLKLTTTEVRMKDHTEANRIGKEALSKLRSFADGATKEGCSYEKANELEKALMDLSSQVYSLLTDGNDSYLSRLDYLLTKVWGNASKVAYECKNNTDYSKTLISINKDIEALSSHLGEK